MKEFISYLWKNGLFSQKEFKTTDGHTLQITSPGEEIAAGHYSCTRLEVDNTSYCGDATLSTLENAQGGTDINISIKN